MNFLLPPVQALQKLFAPGEHNGRNQRQRRHRKGLNPGLGAFRKNGQHRRAAESGVDGKNLNMQDIDVGRPRAEFPHAGGKNPRSFVTVG